MKIMSGCRSGSSIRRTFSPICRRPSTLPDPLPARLVTAGKTVLSFRWPVDLRLTVASHGWAHLAPWRWDPESGRLGRPERIGNRLGTIEVAQRDPAAMIVLWAGFDTAALPEIERRVRRWLSADWEPASAMAALGQDAALIACGGGRLLRCSFFYEDFAKTVLTINTSWSSTCRMAAALVAEPGEGAFPVPEAVLDYGEQRLRERAKLGFRAATLVSATLRLLADGAIDKAGDGEPERLSHDYLLGLKGIGPYAAAHCRLLLHDFARIPVDSAVTAYLQERHGCGPAEFAASRSSWGGYLALGYRLTRLGEKLDTR
jgi:3-methyladenine DNA glycosylase/8-oxoguanine DNA glycosylase